MSVTDGKNSRSPIHYVPKAQIFTKKKIFLKSEAPKALYSSHSFIVSALIRSGVQRSTPSSARWLTSLRRCPNASAAVMGRRKRVGATRTGRGKISTERASGSSRGADMPRWIASSSSRRRRTWGTRNSSAGWMTPLMTLGISNAWDSSDSRGASGGGPSRGA